MDVCALLQQLELISSLTPWGKSVSPSLDNQMLFIDCFHSPWTPATIQNASHWINFASLFSLISVILHPGARKGPSLTTLCITTQKTSSQQPACVSLGSSYYSSSGISSDVDHHSLLWGQRQSKWNIRSWLANPWAPHIQHVVTIMWSRSDTCEWGSISATVSHRVI